MTNAEATSLTREPALSPLESLRRQLSGDILLPGDETYQVARQMISFSHNNFPAVIVKAATNEDVALGVRFAREHGIPLSVRSGGHSVAGHSVIDGAVTIDLTGMKGVTIDPETRLARVQGGARSVDLAWPANQLGLALSTGDTGSVGLGGLVTGGGIGYFVRKYGIAADRLRSATIVTADGDIITASANVNPDLFWAIRGGGGNFGIIVEFEFELVPRRLHRQEEGQAGFEFVLVLPFFFLFFLLMIDLGLMTYSYISVANAAREGARFGAVNCGAGGTCTAADIVDRVIERSGGILDAGDAGNVTVAWADATGDGSVTGRGDAVSVNIDTPYNFLFFPYSIDVRSCSDMRLEQADRNTSLPGGGGC